MIVPRYSSCSVSSETFKMLAKYSVPIFCFLSVISSWERDFSYESKFKLSCVSQPLQEKFKFIYLDEKAMENFTEMGKELKKEFGTKKQLLVQFTGYGDSISVDKMRGTYFFSRGVVQETPNSVVCNVDYAYGISLTILQLAEYYRAIVNRVDFVVRMLMIFTEKLLELKIIENISNLKLIGYCLGGQMAGKFARELKAKHKSSVRMVLALDPSRYGYSEGDVNYNERVTKKDASFVEVIHTSEIGMPTHEAHVDIYVNDVEKNKIQPGCEKESSGKMCSHVAALLLHEYTANKTNIWGLKEIEFYGGNIFASKDRMKKRDDFLIGIHNPDIDNPEYVKKISGVYYLRTGEVFDTPEKGTLEKTGDAINESIKKLIGLFKSK